jgi:hypothetical protein
VYSPPKEHSRWIFDEIDGSPEVIEPKLAAEAEFGQNGGTSPLSTLPPDENCGL